MSTAQIHSPAISGMVVVRATNRPSPAYLLGLPGEVRNHTYGYILGQYVTVTLSKKTNTLRYDLGLIERPAKRWPTMKRTAYGFTQVCRELRTEFLPLYRRNTIVNLQWSTLLQYSSTIFPEPAAATGRFIVMVPDDHIDKDCIDHMTILLWLRQKAPSLKIRIQALCLGDPMPVLNPSTSSRKALAKFFRQVVGPDTDYNRKGLERGLVVFKNMTIVSGGRARIQCEVYAQYRESWMPYIHRRPQFGFAFGPLSAIKKEAVELMRSIGLDVQGASSLSITVEDPEASEDGHSKQDADLFSAGRGRSLKVPLC